MQLASIIVNIIAMIIIINDIDVASIINHMGYHYHM